MIFQDIGNKCPKCDFIGCKDISNGECCNCAGIRYNNRCKPCYKEWSKDSP